LSKYLDSTKVFMAFCDDTRLKVLEILRGGEKSASVLLEQVNVGQSTLSHHMKILVDSGIVSARKVHKWTYYSICESGRQYAVDLLNKLTSFKKNGAKSLKKNGEKSFKKKGAKSHA